MKKGFFSWFALLALSPAIIPAQPVPKGTEFQVNTYTTYSQDLPAISKAGSGNFVVVWTSQVQDGSGFGIFGQRFSKNGTPQGGEFQVNSSSTDNQLYPRVAMDDAGNFVVAWHDSIKDGSDLGIFARRFDGSGSPLGGDFQVNTFTTGIQRFPRIAGDPSGGFVVVWEDAAKDGSGFGVFGRRFDAAGSPEGGEFQIPSTTFLGQKRPDVAVDGNGDFTVTWSSFQDGFGYGIFGQRYDSLGMPHLGEFQTNLYAIYNQYRSSTAADDDDDFVVVWQSVLQDSSDYAIIGRRGKLSVGLQSFEFQVNTYTTGRQETPQVAMDADGNFTVVWASLGQDGSDRGVFGQVYNNAGSRVGGEFRVNTFTPSIQFQPAVVMDSSEIVVVWSSGGNHDGSSRGIFGQRFRSPFAPLCEAPPEPLAQGYWHRQCLGAGLIQPGRSDRGPKESTEPEFETEILPAARSLLEQKVYQYYPCEQGMLADPPSDPCERALRQYTALIFNFVTDRLEEGCGVDLASLGCGATNVGELIDELAALFNSHDEANCYLVEACAGAANEGTGLSGPGAGAGNPHEAPRLDALAASPGSSPALPQGIPADEAEGPAPSGVERGNTITLLEGSEDRAHAPGRRVQESEAADDADPVGNIRRHLALIAGPAAGGNDWIEARDALLTALGGGYEPALRLEIARALAGRLDEAYTSLLEAHLVDIRDEADEVGQREIARDARLLLEHLKSPPR